MDFNLVIVLIFSVIVSTVNCRTYGTNEEDGLLRRVTRRAFPQQCVPMERPANNYSELYEFGQTFARLNEGLKKMNKKFSGDIILFVGNTGVGKSCLVHLLAGDTSNFVAAEIGEETGDFHIVDTTGKDVTDETTQSTTTYPEAVADKESGIIFYDTPGFRDTRSPIHEVIAAYGMQRVTELSKRVKFAFLINHNSLTPHGPRDDFTNALQSFFSLLNNPNKYHYSTYLVATKVDNKEIKKNGKNVLVSDQTIIKSIATFLDKVKISLENRKETTNKQFLTDAQSFIRNLVNNANSRIALFRKPQEGGSIMNSDTIRQSCAAIREILLDADDGYTNVKQDDFGFTLSEKAKIYIRDLFDLMNNFVVDVSKLFTMSFEKFLTEKYTNFVDIGAIRSSLLTTWQEVNVLIHSANSSQYPNEFADALWNFVDAVGIATCSNDTLREIKQLNDILNNLKNVTDTNMYTPHKWADSLYDIERIVKDEQDYYIMLNNFFDKLTSHAALNFDFYVGVNEVFTKVDKKNVVITKHNYPALMEHLGLNQFASLKMNENRLNEINTVFNKAKEQVGNERVSCTNKTLMIAGNFLKLQTLDENKMVSCKEATTVALLAKNKLYIDTNLGVGVLGGRNLVLIAPEWQVMGKFVISVDGESQGGPLEKAPNGKNGLNGKPGKSAGRFVGVALRYFNSEQLMITANGGNGQNGQAGGDGNHGKDGYDGTKKTKVDDSSKIYVVYNSFKDTSIIKADQGQSGGDAGMGGVGGAGGMNGSIEIYSLTNDSPARSIYKTVNGTKGANGKNGTPGQGGLRGCDQTIKEVDRFVLFIPIGSSSTHEMQQCERRNANGKLVSNTDQFSEAPTAVPAPPPVCGLYKKMSALSQSMDDIFSHTIYKEFQSAFNAEFKCDI